MIFLDSNVVIDLFRTGDGPTAAWARHAYEEAVAEHGLVSNLVVFAEVTGRAGSAETLLDLFARFAIGLVDLSPEGAFRGGRAFRDYRRRGGLRDTILPDFLIAGHAEALGATLMTGDRGIAGYFPDLSLITPETHPYG